MAKTQDYIEFLGHTALAKLRYLIEDSELEPMTRVSCAK